ncbi:MAG: acyl-CoA thioesterase II [Halieaceae bacterium]|nr:acyl-CoA thioesterase II [Halieaceae bacterium]
MAFDLNKLLGLLEVERIDKYLFIGRSPSRPARVFGGQVLAQSLNAALRTVSEDRVAHSMHAYFLRPGNPLKQIVYEVDPIRDGRSFTTRRVVAKQEGIAIFNTSISFQVEEQGLSHQSNMPTVTPPEELESDHIYWARLAKEHPGQFDTPAAQPIERKTVDRPDHINPRPESPIQYVWFRARGELGDDRARHQTLLAYMSDHSLLGTTLRRHPYTSWNKNIQAASLDHAIWFHRPFRADEDILYEIESPSASGSRGFSRGTFYTRDGALIASTTQESLIRRVDP